MSTENIKQNSDGTLSIINADGIPDLVVGGPAIPTVTAPRFHALRVMKVPLAAADTGGGVLSFQNLFGFDVVVEKVTLNVTTVATSACTVSVGTTATGATTAATNISSSLDVNTAAIPVGSSTPALLVNGKWLTISKASGAAAGLVGFAFIEYHPV